jgi:hypothetical protein
MVALWFTVVSSGSPLVGTWVSDPALDLAEYAGARSLSERDRDNWVKMFAGVSLTFTETSVVYRKSGLASACGTNSYKVAKHHNDTVTILVDDPTSRPDGFAISYFFATNTTGLMWHEDRTIRHYYRRTSTNQAGQTKDFGR